MSKNRYNIIYSILFMVFISIGLIFLSKNSDNSLLNNQKYTNKQISVNGFYFDTYITISIYDCAENFVDTDKKSKDLNTILQGCLDICEKYELIFSRTNENSQLYMLNNSKSDLSTEYIPVSIELSDIIIKSLDYTDVFNDKFSIFSGDLCDLWDYNLAIIPTAKEINEHLTKLKATDFVIINNDLTCSILSTSPSITLGATAKGYIADKIGEYLKNNGIYEAIINLGGNVLVLGDKYDNEGYVIGIKKPFSNDNEPFIRCKISEMSVVTSGIYERYFEIDKKIYHHIIDCETGYPSDNGILSVTILSKESMIADCYSTGCLLYPIDFILSLVNGKGYEDVECIIIDKDYNVILSDGLEIKNDYIIFK